MLFMTQLDMKFDVTERLAIDGGQPAVDRCYSPGLCPVAEDAFSHWMTLELRGNYTDRNVDEIAFAIAKVAYHLARRPTPSPSG
jgi:hypothetical protein